MAHRTARLNLFGRRLLVTRIAVDGWPIAKAAEAQGVSRTTAHKWTGYSRLRDADRLSRVPMRYVRDHPGALIHRRPTIQLPRRSSGPGARSTVPCRASCAG